MLIRVTQEHIDKGMPLRPDCCPLALAFDDAGIKASVGGTIVSIDKKTYKLPEPAYTFRLKFDMKEEVYPFEFEFELKEFKC